jgi:hypothetical protein
VIVLVEEVQEVVVYYRNSGSVDLDHFEVVLVHDSVYRLESNCTEYALLHACRRLTY